MPLRILHTIHSVNPAGGGPFEGLKQISAVNISQGNSVEIASMDSPDAPWVKACPLPCHAMGPSLPKYGYNTRFVPWLRAHRRDYDVVIVNGIWQYNSFGVWRALHGTSTPYFVFTHGMLDPWFKRTYPLKHLKKWLYWPWGEYRVLRDSTAALFTCEEERRLARQSFWLYKCDECVINYGTAGPVGDPVEQKRIFLEKFPELKGRRLLLFLGRVHVKKGPDILLKAFKQIIEDLPPEATRDLHLVMAGPNDHAYARAMSALASKLGISDRVAWTGMLSGDIKWGAFYASEVFVLPSHQENFGVAVAEALGCGLPVLVSDKVNIWREIQMHEAGMVETDDVEGTRRMLKKWLALPAGQKDAMRARARECFEQRFHVTQTANFLLRLLANFGLRGMPGRENSNPALPSGPSPQG